MPNLDPSPKVSIILPTYNRAKYIGEAIESIQNQTYQNWELIIVDDGSDDNTEEIIKSIKDDRILFYKAGRIGMRGKIKNIGLEKASGELIAFMDSDDLCTQTKLEKQLIAFQQYPEAGFCLANGYNFRKPDEPLEYFYKQREGMKYGNFLIPFFKSEIAATMPTLIFKKHCIQVTGPFKETKSLADIDFILNLASHFKGIILYEPLFYRRLHDSNYSSINWVKRHYEGLEIIRSYESFLPAKIFADSLFRSHIHYGEKCVRHKRTGEAINQFFQAWKNKPLSIVPLKKTAKAILQSFILR